MFKYNFIYELKGLLRSRWIQLLSLILLLLFGFSGYNGKKKVQKRATDIAFAKAEVAETDQVMVKLLDSVGRGLKVSASPWTIPTSPTAVGNYHPRVAAMEPQPMAFIATGQADIFTHYVKPKMSGDDFALNFTEMTSPVQLLFGSFDMTFVIVFLLPLIIIAFSYNVLSAEKESGALKLLASQPIGIQNWVLQKLGLRFLWLSVLVIVVLILVFAVLGLNLLTQTSLFFGLLGLILGYMLFWFALSFLINLWIGSSAKNAVSLLGLWVLFVLLVPSVLNQLGTTVYPMPSRTLMINEMRSLKAEVTKKQDEILDNFLRDHPEYAINDSTQSRTFWHSYMASQKLIKEELTPVVSKYEDQLQNQQEWISRFKWISPAIIAQESLNEMAGTSTRDYENFRRQVVSFAGEWRDHLLPFLYNNTAFAKADIANLPQFEYKESKKSSVAPLIITLISLGLFGLGLATSKKEVLYNVSS
jgi:ABC-2 type transport system permease protein